MELVYRGREIAFEEVCGIFLDPLPVEQLKKSIQEYELMKQDEAKYCCNSKIEMSGFSKVKMSAFRICTSAISLADGLICWCLCRIKNLNDCRSCRKSAINA